MHQALKIKAAELAAASVAALFSTLFFSLQFKLSLLMILFFFALTLFARDDPSTWYRKFLAAKSNESVEYTITTDGMVVRDQSRGFVLRKGGKLIRHGVIQSCDPKKRQVRIKESLALIHEDSIVEFARSATFEGVDDFTASPDVAFSKSKATWLGFVHPKATLLKQLNKPLVFGFGGLQNELLEELSRLQSGAAFEAPTLPVSIDGLYAVKLGGNGGTAEIGFSNYLPVFTQRDWISDNLPSFGSPYEGNKVRARRQQWTHESKHEHLLVSERFLVGPAGGADPPEFQAYSRVFEIHTSDKDFEDTILELAMKIPVGTQVRIASQPQFKAEWNGKKVAVRFNKEFPGAIEKLRGSGGEAPPFGASFYIPIFVLMACLTCLMVKYVR